MGQRAKSTKSEDQMIRLEDDESIRPFTVNVAQEAIDDLRKRLAMTRWPEKETVADGTQGVQLATMQELVRYWATEYDGGSRRG